MGIFVLLYILKYVTSLHFWKVDCIMSIKLFSHNQSAFASALDMLDSVGKAAVVHPTGTGKSYIGFKLCETFPEKTVCWLSPSEYIYQTQLENLKRDSDGWQPENVEFFTYAKLMLMSDEDIAGIQPDYIILDEFHRCGAEMWGEGVQKLLSLYPDVPILGLSATAIRYLDNRRNMADELFDGNIASEMTLGEAIVRGILNPPKYVMSVFSYQEDYDRLRRRVRSTRNKAVKSAAEKYLEALRRALENADGMDVIFDKHMTDRTGKYIVFCSNVEHLNEMKAKVNEWFGRIDPAPHVYQVYTEDPTKSKAFADFKEDNSEHLKLLFAIDMLNEGIHVDDVSGVILFRPTVSPIIYKQQIGRALSASKKNDPIIFDIVNNIENLYSISSIQEEMKVAISYYRFLGQESYIVNDQFTVIDEVREAKELFDKLNDTLTASWDTMYGYAKQYYEQNGDLLVPKTYLTPDGYSLGSWISVQRRVYAGKANGVLTQDRIKKLEAIGIVWDSYSDMTWKRNFAAAEKYYAVHGDLMVPAAYVDDDGVKLGTWISNLRSYRKSGAKSSYMTPDRIKALDAIGMVWDGLDFTWMQNYTAAMNYYKNHGDLRPPMHYVDENGVRLYDWLVSVRSDRRRGITSYLTEDRIAALDQIGMEWRNPNEVRWYEAYSLAQDYYSEHGSLDMPNQYKAPNGYGLGAWLNQQKKKYREGKLDEPYISLLNELDINWDKSSKAYTWDEMYEIAEQYYLEHGNLVVPSDYRINGVWIARWVSNQRQRYIGKKKPPLTDEQIGRLESIGMFWGTRADREWESNFNEAKAYYEKHGDLLVPSKYITGSGMKLGSWIGKLRQSKNSEKPRILLTAKRIVQLDSIGMVWDIDEYLWERNYRIAESYYRKHGNLHVQSDYRDDSGVDLYDWLRRLRHVYERPDRGYLSDEKIAALNRIGMEWDSLYDKRWFDYYSVLKDYYDTHGDLDIPRGYKFSDGLSVKSWLNRQVKCYMKGKMPKERIDLLNRLHIKWSKASDEETEPQRIAV